MRRSFLSLAVFLVVALPSQSQADTRLTQKEARRAAANLVVARSNAIGPPNTVLTHDRRLHIQWTARRASFRINVRTWWHPEPEVDFTASCYALVRVTKRRRTTSKITSLTCDQVFVEPPCVEPEPYDPGFHCPPAYFRPANPNA
jgi:Tfp pilus assembly protein FimT